MISLLKQEASGHGDKLQLLSASRLRELQEEIDLFAATSELNGFQKWIVGSLYRFEIPPADFDIRSVLLVAIPHPFLAKTEFEWKGRTYELPGLAMPDFERTDTYLEDFVSSSGYHLKPAENLPMKRMAAHCGLAAYGRNNICYVEGMGSSFSLAAYYSDIPCDGGDDWAEIKQADACSGCRSCLSNCPTGAIREDRFLIDNEKCLSYLNESPDPFPEWLPKSVHHCLYDCLRCQIKCPMNRPYVGNITGPIHFNEEETGFILGGGPFESFPAVLRQKCKLLGIEQWLGAMPKNLKVLFEQYDNRLLHK